jgi:peptidyl-prolyl cis-trans isomerase SurA
MNNTFCKTALMTIGALLLSATVFAETVERIVAVVGDRAILASELASQVQMYLFSFGDNAEVDPQEVSREMLNEMVNDELILSAARDDTTITATDNEIQAELNAHIASLAARFPSEEAFLEQLHREGMTKRNLEKKYYPQIRDQILKQKIINKKLSKISVSRQEVEQFYARYADSLPEIPSRIRLAHILIGFRVSPATEDSLRQIAEEARQLALQGTDFEEVAKEYSSRGHDVVGGRIGFVRRGELVEEFGRTAFNLQPGSVSGLVLTEYGWHIIKSHVRLHDSVDVSQVLFPIAPSLADSIRAGTLADSLYTELQGGVSFKELAKLHSDDDSSRSIGGELEPMTLDQLRPEFVAALEGIDTGRIAPPIISQRGYHILKLLEREESRRLNIDTDFDIIRNLARQEKTAQMVEDWVAKLKKKIYVDIRDLNY